MKMRAIITCILGSFLQIITVSLLETSIILASEEETQQQWAPKVTLSTGLRSMTLGCSIEGYFLNGEMSAILGFGSIPPPGASYSGWSKPVYTVVLRKYFGELNNRPFVDLSFSAVATSNLEGPDYGPGLQLGYCILADFGLTLNVGIGGGYAIRNQIFGPTIILDLGFTFR